jgi:hypothetical protein
VTQRQAIGQRRHAVGTFELALAKVRGLGDPVGEAYVLQGVGVANVRVGEFGRARTALQRALELPGTTGERHADARALLGLSELALASGDPAQAVVFAQRASGAFAEFGAPLHEARALTLLGEAHTALGDGPAADAASAQAAALRAHLTGGTATA